MWDRQTVRTDKTKWLKSRKCACGDCRFFSQEERPKCPAMVADPKLVGEWLWYLDLDMLGCKDYADPSDFKQPEAYTEKEEVNEGNEKDSQEPIQ